MKYTQFAPAEGWGFWRTVCMVSILIGVVIMLQFRFIFNLVSEKVGSIAMEKGVCGGEVQRIGDKTDGGWFLCKPTTWNSGDSCVTYSFGIKDNFSFDKASVEMGCKVHGFDPSPFGLSSKAGYEAIGGEYHSYGLGKRDGVYAPGEVSFNWPGLNYLKHTNTAEWELKSLSTILNTLNPIQKPKLTIRKIDVEGAELEAMEDLLYTEWDQLLIEMHFTPKYYKVSPFGEGGMLVSRVFHNFISDTINPPQFDEPKYDYIEALQKLDTVAELWQWNYNTKASGDLDKKCVEAYFQRRRS